jgi:hypothetical protein
VDFNDVKLGQQGTWQFLAVDLMRNPNITQTFIHDLESVFYLLLFLALRYMQTSWQAKPSQLSYALNVIMNPPAYGGIGGSPRLWFMRSPLEPEEFEVLDGGSKPLCNQPFTALMYDLKTFLAERHSLPQATHGSIFLDIDAYEKVKYRHDAIIEIFDTALSSSRWPENDAATPQPIVDFESAVSSQYTSSERSSSTYESSGSSAGSGGRNPKRQKLI